MKQGVLSTVPFRLIRQSRVIGPSGPALILVHVTGHIDFGRMGKMVQKKAFTICATYPSIDMISGYPFRRLIFCRMQILFVTGHTASGPTLKMRPLCHWSHPRTNQSKWYSNFFRISFKELIYLHKCCYKFKAIAIGKRAGPGQLL